MNQDDIDQQLKALNAQLDGLKAQASTGAAPPAGSEAWTWWSVKDAMTISAVVLVFGLAVLVLAAWLIRSGQRTESVLRVFGTIIIIVSAVFLVVAGYTDTQIAPVMGLLGTIVGYLLGKDNRGANGQPAPGTRKSAEGGASG